MRRKAAIVACSNALPSDRIHEVEQTRKTLAQMGISTELSPHIFCDTSPLCAPPQEKASVLNEYFRDGTIEYIFDISGGDAANEVIPYLDYSAIEKSNAQMWGYSDLTCVLNAIYTMTGRSSVLYQVRHAVKYPHLMKRGLNGESPEFFSPPVNFINGWEMEGIAVGGNIRCLLKLAGTKYFPPLDGTILVLESLGCTQAAAAALFSQLAMMGAFERVSGVILGRFTRLEQEMGENAQPFLLSLITRANSCCPVAVTPKIGHDENASAIIIGGCIPAALFPK